jgi:predicted DsbA family dithiol-disulfide isomerase
VQWVFFPLHPDTPADGQSLDELFAGRGLDLRAMHQRMAALMRSEGLPYGERTFTYNSRLAQELGKWADTRGVEAIHDAVYRAYFVDNRNIGDVEELVTLAGSVGLPKDEARDVLSERRFRQAVDADWVKSRQYGVTGVPTFVSGEHGVVGAQPYEMLEQLVRAAGALPLRGSASS